MHCIMPSWPMQPVSVSPKQTEALGNGLKMGHVNPLQRVENTEISRKCNQMYKESE